MCGAKIIKYILSLSFPLFNELWNFWSTFILLVSWKKLNTLMWLPSVYPWSTLINFSFLSFACIISITSIFHPSIHLSSLKCCLSTHGIVSRFIYYQDCPNLPISFCLSVYLFINLLLYECCVISMCFWLLCRFNVPDLLTLHCIYVPFQKK